MLKVDMDVFVQRGGQTHAHIIYLHREGLVVSFDQHRSLYLGRDHLHERPESIEQGPSGVGDIIDENHRLPGNILDRVIISSLANDRISRIQTQVVKMDREFRMASRNSVAK